MAQWLRQWRTETVGEAAIGYIKWSWLRSSIFLLPLEGKQGQYLRTRASAGFLEWVWPESRTGCLEAPMFLSTRGRRYKWHFPREYTDRRKTWMHRRHRTTAFPSQAFLDLWAKFLMPRRGIQSIFWKEMQLEPGDCPIRLGSAQVDFWLIGLLRNLGIAVGC